MIPQILQVQIQNYKSFGRTVATAPPDPEQIRGAKERLSGNMAEGRRYIEVDDQPGFADCMDIGPAKARCPSFARLVRKVENLISHKDRE